MASEAVQPFVGYPFEFYINNSTTPTPLICDSYDNDMGIKGETWTATVSPFLQGIAGSLFGPSMTPLDYKAAGFDL